jgi:hypothetical protein
LPKLWKFSPKFWTKKIGRKKTRHVLGNAKNKIKKRRLKERNQEKCGFSIAISTNFAKFLENVAQISDIQNWEEKKKKVMFWAMKKKTSLKKNGIRRNVCFFSIVKSTNFAKTLENVAQISDIQNWEKKKT